MYVIESKFFVFPWVEWICIFLLNEGVAVDVWICAATFLWCETPGKKQCEKIMMASLCVIWYDYLLLLLELMCCENVPEVRLWERPLAIKTCFCQNCASFFFLFERAGKNGNIWCYALPNSYGWLFNFFEFKMQWTIKIIDSVQ